MAEYYGFTGKVLRVDLSTGAITTESTDKYKAFLGGTGFGWKVLWDEVAPGTKAFDPDNRLVFGVGPLTGGGSPCSGRTSIVTLWPVDPDELPAAGHFGGHWGPELKYAGYDSLIVQGKAEKPVWIRIEDGEVTIEDAAEIWGEGIYRSTNYINTLMGTDAHVACIGQAGENQVRMAAAFTDRSHRAGGVGGVMGSKNLKAIGVKGTGAVKIAADKATWKAINKNYLSLMGANNQCVVARELQPWSEYSPGGTRWSGRKGVLWGAANPPVDLGTCPDVEHPTEDAPNPLNKIGLRTQKGFNDYGAEGMRRTVRMDGCHSCPIRCHIAADHPELMEYGLNRYNMNTCMGNSGAGWYTNTAGANAVTNPMLLAYMANNLEGDYGIWNDYGGWHMVFKWAYKTTIVVDAHNPATVKDAQGNDIPNPDLGKTILQKYLPAAEYTRLRTTVLAGSGKSPFDLLDAGDPRWLQFILAEVSNPPADAATNPAHRTLGYFMGLGGPWLAKQWPELQDAFNVASALQIIKRGHTKHHGIETNGQLGALINAMQTCRDANAHTHQNFYTNGLPDTVQREIAQEIACDGHSIFTATDESAQGKWAWDLKATNTPMNAARAAFIAQCMIWYELQNCLTECNYTLPVWASPLKSRGYRGDPTLNAQVLSAITGEEVSHKELETIGLRVFTLLRVLTARYMNHAHPETKPGQNMRQNFDQLAEWMFKPANTSVTALDHADVEVGKELVYEQLGWDKATGLPTAAKLQELGLGDLVPTLRSEGLIPA